MAKITARFSTPGGKPYRGRVVFSPLADVVLGARGDRVNILVGDFEAPLDSTGFFSIDLPPGQYTARFKIDNADSGQVGKIRDVLITVKSDSTLADLIAPPAAPPAGAIRVNERDLANGVIA